MEKVIRASFVAASPCLHMFGERSRLYPGSLLRVDELPNSWSVKWGVLDALEGLEGDGRKSHRMGGSFEWDPRCCLRVKGGD